MIVVPKGILEARRVASQERTRYALQSLRFERGKDGKARAVASDGKRLAIFTWDDLELRGEFPETGLKGSIHPGWTAHVPLAQVEKALKVMPKKRLPGQPEALAIEEGEPGIRIAVCDGDGHALLKCASVEGHYPPYEDVIPKAGVLPTFATTLNADLLVGLVETLHAAQGRKGDVARLEFFGVDGPIRVTTGSGGDVEAMGLLMPVATDAVAVAPAVVTVDQVPYTAKEVRALVRLAQTPAGDASEAEKRASEAEKRASEAEKRASEAEKRASEAEKRLKQVASMAAA